jgi:hypothetical protein
MHLEEHDGNVLHNQPFYCKISSSCLLWAAGPRAVHRGVSDGGGAPWHITRWVVRCHRGVSRCFAVFQYTAVLRCLSTAVSTSTAVTAVFA